jgi:hypothetical protein
LRFLANLSDFDPAKLTWCRSGWNSIVTPLTHELQQAVLHDHSRYEFHLSRKSCTCFVRISQAILLDILKDRPLHRRTWLARRSAQALYHVANTLLRLFLPF